MAIAVLIENEEFTLDGEFQDCLEAVKALPRDKRQWDAKAKKWLIFMPLAEAKEALTVPILSEDEAIDAEFQAIIELQEELVARTAELEAESSAQWNIVKGYSYQSKQRRKFTAMTNAGCLNNAITASKKQPETLTEIEIKGMGRALRIINGEE